MYFLPINLIGRFFRDGFDINPALGTNYHHWHAAFPVQQYREVHFTLNLNGFCHHDFSNQATIRTGLIRHEVVTQHVLSKFTRFGRSRTKPYPALKPILENALASTSRMNLCFHYEMGCLEVSGCFFCLFRRISRQTLRRGNSETLEEFFCLVFVDIHEENERRPDPADLTPT